MNFNKKIPGYGSLTVVMTVYNGMPYLEESVQSILDQSLPIFTFLIVNNASEDGTRAFLDDLNGRRAGLSPYLRIEHLSVNLGRTGALNLALERVDTEFTAIMDADDVSVRSRLERQIEFMREHPEVVLLGADVDYIDEKGQVTGSERFPIAHADLRDHLPLYNPFANSACMFRTESALVAGGYDSSFAYAQDLALWVVMLRSGGRAASLNEKLVSIRRHGAQSTRDAAMSGARALDNRRISEAILEIPDLGINARQAALLRLALALYGLGEKNPALARIWEAVREKPLAFCFNPLLWRRLLMQGRKLLQKI
ncbi:MAG: glycosyltransferase [Desulfovibrio sp.]|jgi:glycosyltransferase involved in cell wall biosynthesis|nr:glycosyltransferase [Desulfovibrio sp.]